MKSIILFVLSLLLILEKQAAVMGQKGGSKGQLSSGSSRFPHRHRSQHYSGQKDKQHTESKGSFSIQHTYHVDANDHDRTRKSQQYYLNAQHKTTKSKQHLRRHQRLLNYKQKGRGRVKPKRHFHLIVIHRKGGQVHHGTQNPSQDQGNSPSGKGISSQYSNTEERLRVRGLSKEQASASGAQKGRTQGGSQTNYVLQTEELVANKQQRETQNSHRNKGHYQNVVDVREEHSSKLQTSLRPAHQHKLQHGYKDIFTTQDELLVYNKNQHQTKNLNQDQEHGRKAHKGSYQSSSTEERQPNHEEKSVQKGVPKGSISIQTEEKIYGKSQNQVTIPSQDQEHGHKENKISYQSSSAEERRLNSGEKGIQKGVPKGSISIQTEEKIYGKSQNQVTIPSQDQEHGHKEYKTSYQSSSTEERRLNSGEKGIQKGVSKGSISIQTEEQIHGESQNQVTISKQNQEHGHKKNKISYQSSSTEERQLNSGEKDIQNSVSKGSTSIQTEEKIHGKSQNQVAIPSQDQEHGHKENKISYQSSSAEERQLNSGEKGIQKGVSKGSISIQTEEKIYGKSQNQVTIPSQDQEHGHKENKIAYQSSSTEERQLNYGGKSIQKDVSQSSLSFQTEKLVEGKSQIQTPNPNQGQWSGQNAKGNSGKSADRKQDLLSHEQEGRYQQEFSGAHNTVNIEHKVAYDDLLTQQYNEDRNPIST
ncbi:semenogelin-2 [Macaca thibetana thibetana]|uniref:semenogelin-2 n=1 Tax=Macaca thibetana thibetana TaxID=257877 RepID=UPI0021BC4D2F|nr:semenogelin-2 [Macaca thibetana thibetana]